jgi:hypothetical protein
LDARTLKEVMGQEKLTWRSFADPQHSISDRWNEAGTPTLVAIDAEGVIRHKWFGSPGNDTLDGALERIIKKAETPAKRRP